MMDLSALTKKVNARVKEYLEKPCFGCMNPISNSRNWERTTIRGALSHTVASQAALEKLAKLAETAENSAGESPEIYKAAMDDYKAAKRKAAQGHYGGLGGFQFTHSFSACKKDVVKDAKPTGIYFGDVDHIPAEMMDKARAALLAMPAAFAVGESVSRRGLAVALAYNTDGFSLTSAAMLKVFDAVKRAIDDALKAANITGDVADVEADEDAKNPVRWRFGLQNVAFKDDDAVLTLLRITDGCQKETPKSSAETGGKETGEK